MRHLTILSLIIIMACATDKRSDKENPEEKPEGIAAVSEPQFFELRTYYAADGKLEDLLARFRDHTTRIFEKHGMVNVAYWVPVDNGEEQLIYMLGYKDEADRNRAWEAFRADPQWIEAKNNSEVDGSLVDSVQSIFLSYTDYSPKVELADGGPRVFEMRTYFTNEGKLANLHTRFRDNTMKIFENNSMTNVAYFDLDPQEDGFDNTLLYFISHADTAAARQNWQNFIADPDWTSVYEASIEDGRLVNKINSVFLSPVDFSPMK